MCYILYIFYLNKILLLLNVSVYKANILLFHIIKLPNNFMPPPPPQFPKYDDTGIFIQLVIFFSITNKYL